MPEIGKVLLKTVNKGSAASWPDVHMILAGLCACLCQLEDGL